MDGFAHAVAVVDVGVQSFRGDFEQLVALAHPPDIRRKRIRGFGLEQLFPARAERRAAARLANDRGMQLANQARALLGVDDEAQVQVVRGLRHQVDALLLEDLERGGEP